METLRIPELICTVKFIHLPKGHRDRIQGRDVPQTPWRAVKEWAPVEGVPGAAGTAEDKGPGLEYIKTFSAFVL